MDEKQKKIGRNPGIGILVIGIILLASSLRGPFTSVGPLTTSIRDSLMVSNTVIGALTTLPLLAFAFISPFAPKLSRRFGVERTLFIALIVLTLGIFIRSSGGIIVLFVGTLLIGLAIAIGNVLLPGLVKQNFVHRIGLMTGVYAVSMNLSAGIASGVSVPIASFKGIGWQGALGLWGLLTVVAILFWIPQLRHQHKSVKEMETPVEKRSNQLWRSSLAWKITIFMGLQSLIFYSIVAWVPEILQEKGLTSSAAGWMISIMQFATLPFTFIVPIIAGRLKSQQGLVAITTLLFSVGIVGILTGNVMLTPLWMILIGSGCGFAFGLAMMFFTLRTESVQEASEISGMAQSIGYLLAATGPLFFGFMRDFTGSWTTPLVLLIISCVVLFIAGMGAGKEGYIKKMN